MTPQTMAELLAEVDDDTAAVRFDDRGGDDLAALLHLRHLLPAADWPGPAQRQHGVTLRSLRVDHEREGRVTDPERLTERRVRLAQLQQARRMSG